MAGVKIPVEEVITELRRLADPKRLVEHQRVAAGNQSSIGVSVPNIRSVSRRHRRDHQLALALWDSGIHEARQLAVMVEDPQAVTREQCEAWVADIDSWDVCDGACDLYAGLPFAWELAREWVHRDAEFTKRAGFVIIAWLAVHAKGAADDEFVRVLPLLREGASDDRNFVKKAVNWALRQIGKRNLALNAAAIGCAERIQADGTRSGRWVAADALRELRSDAVQTRLASRA